MYYKHSKQHKKYALIQGDNIDSRKKFGYSKVNNNLKEYLPGETIQTQSVGDFFTNLGRLIAYWSFPKNILCKENKIMLCF